MDNTDADATEFAEPGADFDSSGESGQGLAEYALILAFIALACAVALSTLGNTLANSPGFKIFD